MPLICNGRRSSFAEARKIKTKGLATRIRNHRDAQEARESVRNTGPLPSRQVSKNAPSSVLTWTQEERGKSTLLYKNSED